MLGDSVPFLDWHGDGRGYQRHDHTAAAASHTLYAVVPGRASASSACIVPGLRAGAGGRAALGVNRDWAPVGAAGSAPPPY
ncbi:hypothetical protein [Streptomyces sp. NBC_01207]|uniref:hypothetical protein n=1 Tax=Streptomyces sp. NBC_01207 TaxID=2903772 RepID=UPI002E1231F6|nr:hypothetical protein OG457_01135 [Streptomyces sp. NBC_01207]